MEVINKLYISLVSHPGGTKQGKGESSGKFASNPLEDLSWPGLIKRVFLQLQHNCSCDQRESLLQMLLIRHIERSHLKDKDSVTFCVRTTLNRATSLHSSIVTQLKKKYGEGTSSKEFCPNCGTKFQCLTQGVFENGGALMVYSNDMVSFDKCLDFCFSCWKLSAFALTREMGMLDAIFSLLWLSELW